MNFLVGRSILLTAIVSTYNAAEFIQGCLQDLENQTIADQMEIIVIDSASEQDEAAAVKDFQIRYANIKYIRTPVRETVYQAWNRGIKLASGKYITNANTDDRHRHDAFEQMVTVMQGDKNVALVYADVIKTRTANQTFNQCTPTGMFRWHDWDRKTLLARGCFIGPQPVWRKKVHEEYGYFDERYEVSSDFEFWLRISQTNDFYHIPKPLGLYLDRQDSVEHANYAKKVQEDTQILQRYRDADKKSILIGVAHNVQKDKNRGEKQVHDDKRMAEGRRDEVKTSANEKYAQGMHHKNLSVTILKAIESLINDGMQEAAYWAIGKFLLDFPDNAQVHVDPDNIEALVISGNVSISLHHYTEAKKYYRQVMLLDPHNHKVKKIIEKMNQAAEIKSAWVKIDDLYNAASVKIQEGDQTAAICLLQQLVAQDDAHGLAHNDLGVLNYETGNMEAALKHYKKASDLMPENETFQKNLADFYWFEMGDHQRAMERYVNVLKLNSQDVEAQLGCSQICLSLGKKADARDFINIALEIDPRNEDARMMQRQLEDSS